MGINKIKKEMKSKFVIIIIIATILAISFLTFSKNFNQRVVLCKGCNVILISIDTLRADHLGIYGYERNTSPNIDNFFKNGFVFKNAFSQAPNTLPSHMSMFTGLYPSNHRVISIDGNVSLSTQKKTIAEILKLYGYKTGGFYRNLDYLDPKFGFSRGFDEYIPKSIIYNPNLPFGFLSSNKDKKFFLFMHTAAVHDPYVAPPPYDTLFDKDYNGSIIGNEDDFWALFEMSNASQDDFSEIRTFYWSRVNKSDPRDINHLTALYDGNIKRVDDFFGKFIERLDSLNLLNNTIIILTSDHGEEFGEHGGFLHEKLYDETIHVPLLIFVPNSRQHAIENQVGSIDILPTVLSILGLQPPENIDGRSLKFLMENPNSVDKNQVIYSEFLFQRARRTPEWKFIKTVNGTISYEFFDLKNNPREQVNLHGKGLEEEKEFKQLLEEWEVKMNSSYVNVQFVNSTFIGYP